MSDPAVAGDAPGAIADGFELVARLADVPPSGLLSVRKADGTRVCLIQLGDQVRGIADNCTHREFALSEGELHDDGTLECAWHGAKFDTASGEATQGPAIKPVVRYAVRVRGGDVWVGGRMP